MELGAYGLTLELVLRPAALQQREVTHNVLQLHHVPGLWGCGCLQGCGAAFDQLQSCATTEERSHIHTMAFILVVAHLTFIMN